MSLGLAQPAMAAIHELLARLASACRAHSEGRLPDEILGRLDNTIALTVQEPASESRNEALYSLTGMRAGLFPGAVPYLPHDPHQGRVAA